MLPIVYILNPDPDSNLKVLYLIKALRMRKGNHLLSIYEFKSYVH